MVSTKKGIRAGSVSAWIVPAVLVGISQAAYAEGSCTNVVKQLDEYFQNRYQVSSEGAFRKALNIHADKSLDVLQALAERGLPPAKAVLKVINSGLPENSEASAKQQRLRQLKTFLGRAHGQGDSSYANLYLSFDLVDRELAEKWLMCIPQTSAELHGRLDRNRDTAMLTLSYTVTGRESERADAAQVSEVLLDNCEFSKSEPADGLKKGGAITQGTTLQRAVKKTDGVQFSMVTIKTDKGTFCALF